MSPIPIIGLDAPEATVAAAIGEACERVGFLVVTDHGVSDDVGDPAWSAARAFFDLPAEVKATAPAPHAANPYGYAPIEHETLAASRGDVAPPDLKESFAMGPVHRPARLPDDPDAATAFAPTPWPDEPAGMAAAWTAYFEAMAQLSARLLSLMAVALGLPSDHFSGFLDGHASAMRALNYPDLDGPVRPGQLRAAPHSDYGTLTILRHDDAPGGLEVFVGGRWTAVPVVPGGLVVNLGDLMARWTNDRWVSTLHRVVLPPPDVRGSTRRQSMAFFHTLAWDAEVRCLPTCRGPGERPRHRPVRAGPYLMERFRSTVSG